MIASTTNHKINALIIEAVFASGVRAKEIPQGPGFSNRLTLGLSASTACSAVLFPISRFY